MAKTNGPQKWMISLGVLMLSAGVVWAGFIRDVATKDDVSKSIALESPWVPHAETVLAAIRDVHKIKQDIGAIRIEQAVQSITLDNILQRLPRIRLPREQMP